MQILGIQHMKCKLVVNGSGADYKKEGPNLLILHALFHLSTPLSQTQTVPFLVTAIGSDPKIYC
uniref:Uncharacterized protein n=1 Tax=Rhizophora mucronata TaxID=61149 RepID=A0A2P2L3Q9_RHIMU